MKLATLDAKLDTSIFIDFHNEGSDEKNLKRSQIEAKK